MIMKYIFNKTGLLVALMGLGMCMQKSLGQTTQGSWKSFADGLFGGTYSMVEFNGEIYCGGYHIWDPDYGVAKWDGSQWLPLPGLSGSVSSLAVYNNELYAGGYFGKTVSRDNGFQILDYNVGEVYKWTGTTWINILDGDRLIAPADAPGKNYEIAKLSVFNNELYVGGIFSTFDGVEVESIIKYNGSTWSSLSPKAGDDSYVKIQDMDVYNNRLMISGQFSNLYGTHSNSLASWNGSSWAGLGNLPTSNYGGNFGTYNGNLYLSAGDLYQYSPDNNFTLVTSLPFGISGPFYAYNGLLYFTDNYNVYSWNGTTFQNVGIAQAGEFGIILLGVSGDKLILGGDFSEINGLQTYFVAYLSPDHVSCTSCVPSFSPLPGEKYLLSAWVKEKYIGISPATYSNSAIKISFNNGADALELMRPDGPVVEGWQRIEKPFLVPIGAQDMDIQLVNYSATTDVYFDDIRIHPFRSNMKSFAYDPSTQKLTAELDENNYATRYEYDDEGILIRVKKETERGVMTIKETRNNQSKIAR
jgi:hypothetical protein